jgi:imidazolonepropionase-like amidohydrolase
VVNKKYFDNIIPAHMNNRLITLLCSVLILLSGSTTIAAESIVISNINLIDIETGAVSLKTVVIENGLISDISDPETVKKNKPEQMIDGSGKYLIPGLWDMHVHLTGDPRISPELMFSLFIANGVTSVRDTGGKLELALTAREQSRQAHQVAPTVYIAGDMIDGQPRVFDGSNFMFPDMSVGVLTPEAGRREVNRLVDAGVDLIKAYELLNAETFKAVVDQANKRTIPITAHVPLSLSVTEAVAAGLNGMEHLRNLEFECSNEAKTLREQRSKLLNPDPSMTGGMLRRNIYKLQRGAAVNSLNNELCDPVIKSLAKNKVAQVPTLVSTGLHLARLYDSDQWKNTFRYLPGPVQKQWTGLARGLSKSRKNLDPYKLTLSQWYFDIVKQMQAEGVSIMAGTDTPIMILTPGFSLHQELIMLVRAGLSPLQALRAATINSAGWFGLENKTGTVAVGKHADLLILDANPLTDISNTQKIEAVVARGRLYDRNDLDQLLAPTE